jgi:hypothetical protein
VSDRKISLSEGTLKALDNAKGYLEEEIRDFGEDDELDQEDDRLTAWVEALGVLADELDNVDTEMTVGEAK